MTVWECIPSALLGFTNVGDERKTSEGGLLDSSLRQWRNCDAIYGKGWAQGGTIGGKWTIRVSCWTFCNICVAMLRKQVVLISVPLIIGDVEHLFMCLLAICMSTTQEWIKKVWYPYCCSVTKSFPTLCMGPHKLQHSRLPCPSPSPGVCSNSCPLSRWCHPTISSSVVSFASCLQSFPASGSFPMGQLFASGGQSTGASASASVLPTNIQG